MITIENNDKDITIENDKNQPYVKKIILNKDLTDWWSVLLFFC